jgi:hypothetical protein
VSIEAGLCDYDSDLPRHARQSTALLKSGLDSYELQRPFDGLDEAPLLR